jgi:MFS family permease
MKRSFHESRSAPAPPPLRRHRDYRLLWTSRTIAVTGSEVSKLAVPLTAASLLSASPLQMGLLTAAGFVPYLLFGLQAGALADRLRRHRPLMIACELAACGAALAVPVAWWLGVLNVPLLVCVAFVIGAAGAVYRAASFPHLAAVVPAAQRTEAMAGLQASYSVASVTGPGLAGLLVQTLTAPLAVLAEALSSLAAALLMSRIHTPENRSPAPSRGMWRDIREGLRTALRHRSLRALIAAGMTINFFAMAYTAVYMLYMLRELGIPAGALGLFVMLGGLGGLAGAWLTARISVRVGTNALLRWSVLLFPLNIFTVGLISGPLWWKLAVIGCTGLVTGGIVVVFATCLGAIVLRESPAELQGRVNATFTFAIQGVLAVGGAAGGAAAELVGLRPVVLACAAGLVLSGLWIWFSPLRHPDPAPAAA